MCNNYSMNALLNFILVVFYQSSGHQNNSRQPPRRKIAISHDWRPKAALISHCLGDHILLQPVSCHSNGIITGLTDATLF